jgi:carbamoyl-phosphate synthase large subunit
MKKPPTNVLVAGIGGASLGTEILKCLQGADQYRVFGCDVSPLAYGHYGAGFADTFLVDRAAYVTSVLELCKQLAVSVVVPGADEPGVLLSAAARQFETAGIKVAANSPRVAAICADKSLTISTLRRAGFEVPRTFSPGDPSILDERGCFIVKPATGSGGSSHVFYARSGKEAAMYGLFLEQQAREAVIQEYLPDDEGEFTIGVLSLPASGVVGSIAMRRLLTPKLSHSLRGEGYVVSSGYSQGLIDDFQHVRRTAEAIAAALGSEGPLNVQGRVRNGSLVPFEINARFSASAYLRARAGFNEVALFLEFLVSGKRGAPEPLRPGYYLRSLSETSVPLSAIKK